MVRISVPSENFQVRAVAFRETLPITGVVTFTHDFYVDLHEVTVDEYNQWIRNTPCDGCSLDPGGPYGGRMSWEPSWTSMMTPHPVSYVESNPSSGCDAPAVPGNMTTWDSRHETTGLPMTCVSWYEAVAYCASVGKRLLTHAEWLLTARGGVDSRPYPWGDDEPLDCATTIFHDGPTTYCDFPVPVGSADGDRTGQGVYDMGGSVFEWVWDAPWDTAPSGENYFRDPSGAGDRTRKGGSYIVPEDALDNRMLIDVFQPFSPTEFYADAGFRCAKSVTD
jgi:formylglycine-generating enzyme required for sulfatase activity